MNASNRVVLWMLGGGAAGLLLGFLFVTMGLETEAESADGSVSVWGITVARPAIVERMPTSGGSTAPSLWGRRLQLGFALAGCLIGIAAGTGIGAQTEINRLEARLRMVEARQAVHRP